MKKAKQRKVSASTLLTSLPVVLSISFQLFTTKELLHLSQVCKSWRQTIDMNSELDIWKFIAKRDFNFEVEVGFEAENGRKTRFSSYKHLCVTVDAWAQLQVFKAEDTPKDQEAQGEEAEDEEEEEEEEGVYKSIPIHKLKTELVNCLKESQDDADLSLLASRTDNGAKIYIVKHQETDNSSKDGYEKETTWYFFIKGRCPLDPIAINVSGETQEGNAPGSCTNYFIITSSLTGVMLFVSYGASWSRHFVEDAEYYPDKIEKLNEAVLGPSRNANTHFLAWLSAIFSLGENHDHNYFYGMEEAMKEQIDKTKAAAESEEEGEGEDDNEDSESVCFFEE